MSLPSSLSRLLHPEPSSLADARSSSDEEEEEEEAAASSGSESADERPAERGEPYLRICFREPEQKPRSQLGMLSLRGYPKVTDAALHYLRDVDLELLDVAYTNVSAMGVRNFMTLHPNCRVIHESACTCGPRMHF